MQSLEGSGSDDDAPLVVEGDRRGFLARLGLLDSDDESSDESVKSETSEDRAFIGKYSNCVRVLVVRERFYIVL
jgi:hypothetical protein